MEVSARALANRHWRSLEYTTLRRCASSSFAGSSFFVGFKKPRTLPPLIHPGFDLGSSFTGDLPGDRAQAEGATAMVLLTLPLDPGSRGEGFSWFSLGRGLGGVGRDLEADLERERPRLGENGGVRSMELTWQSLVVVPLRHRGSTGGDGDGARLRISIAKA